MGIPLDELQIDIVVNSDAAASALKDLATNLRDVGRAGKEASGGISSAAKKVEDLGNTSSASSSATAQTSSALKDTDKSAKDASKSLTVTTQTLKQITKDGEKTSKTITRVSRELKTLADGTKEITIDKEIEKTGDATEEAGNKAEKSASKFSMFVHSIGRIAMYRAIRSAIKLLTQAVSEGFNMFVTWDREQNNFGAGAAANVDKLTASWTQLKGQIGALGGALANTLVPIITWVVDALTKVVDLFQMIIRSLQGEYTYYKLVYKEASATTGAAKELKRVLFGFDDLNVLPSQSGGGVSSSGGSWLYEELPINSGFLNTIADASNKIKEFFGLNKDGQNIIGGLAGVVGILLGGKALGGLLRLLPGLITGFKQKNQTLADQTTQTQAETSAVSALVPAFAMALGAASAFNSYLKKNPSVVTTAVEAISPKLAKVYNDAKAWLKDKALMLPVTISAFISNNFNSLVSTISGWIASLQGYARSNPIIIPVYEKMYSSSSAVPSGSMSANPNTSGGYLTHGKTNAYQNTGSSPVSIAGSGTSASAYNQLLYINNIPYNSLKSLSDLSKLEIPEPIYNEIYALADYNRLDNIKNWLKGIKHINVPMNPAYGNSTSSFLSTLMLQLQQIAGMAFGFYASGGTPSVGTLYWAGENGSEIVANASSGRTGVMNVNQMQDAVANGNIELINTLIEVGNMLGSIIQNKDSNVYLDGAKIGQSVSRYQSNQARRGLAQGVY